MRKRLLIVMGVAVSVVLLGMVVAGAAPVGADAEESIIYAAYHRITGNLRIVTGGNLRPNEVPIHWNDQGPRGPQGEPGPPGDSQAVENLEELVQSLVAAELSQLLAVISALEARVSLLEQEVGLTPKDLKITGVPPQRLTVGLGTELQEVESLLPGSVVVYLEDESARYLQVQWNPESGGFDGDEAGTYVFSGDLLMEEGIVNPDGLTAAAYVTVPARIWLGYDREFTFEEEAPWDYTYEVEITDLPADTQFQVSIRRGATPEAPHHGMDIFSHVYQSSADGAINLSLPDWLLLEPGDLVTVREYEGGLVASHGVLVVSKISTTLVTTGQISGEAHIPAGLFYDYPQIHVLAGDPDNPEWLAVSHPISGGNWQAEHSGSIYPEMKGSIELRYQHGSGIRFFWEIPGCWWAGNVTSWLYGEDITLTANGSLQTELGGYSWPTPWTVLGEPSGTATAALTVEQDGQYYDTWHITGTYGYGSVSLDGTNAMSGEILNDDGVLGTFLIWQHGWGTPGWTGEARVLLPGRGDYTLLEWIGFNTD